MYQSDIMDEMSYSYSISFEIEFSNYTDELWTATVFTKEYTLFMQNIHGSTKSINITNMSFLLKNVIVKIIH